MSFLSFSSYVFLRCEKMCSSTSSPRHSVLQLGPGLRIIILLILHCATVAWCLKATDVTVSAIPNRASTRLCPQNVVVTGGKNETVGIYFPYSNVSIVYHYRYSFNASARNQKRIYSDKKVIGVFAKYFSVRRYNEETDELRITGWDSRVAGTYIFDLGLLNGGGDPAVELTYLETDPVCGKNVGSYSSKTSLSIPSNTLDVQLYCSVNYVGNLVPTNSWRVTKVMKGTAVLVVNYTPRTVNFSDGAGTRGLTFLIDLGIPQTLVPINYSCDNWIFFNQQSISHSLDNENIAFSQEIANYSFNGKWEFTVAGTVAEALFTERHFSVTDISITTDGIYDDANKFWMLVAFIFLGVIVIVALLSLAVVSLRIWKKRIRKDADSQVRSWIPVNIDAVYDGLIIYSEPSNSSSPLTSELSSPSPNCHHVDENFKSSISAKENVSETENESYDQKYFPRINDILNSVETSKSVGVKRQSLEAKHPVHPPFPSSPGQPYDYATIDNVPSVHHIDKSCGLPQDTGERILHLNSVGYESLTENAEDGPMDSMEHIKSKKTRLKIHPDVFPVQYEKLDTVRPIIKNLKTTKDYVNVPKALTCTRQNAAILSLRHLTVPKPPAMPPR